jgi:hypothetical protein
MKRVIFMFVCVAALACCSFGQGIPGHFGLPPADWFEPQYWQCNPLDCKELLDNVYDGEVATDSGPLYVCSPIMPTYCADYVDQGLFASATIRLPYYGYTVYQMWEVVYRDGYEDFDIPPDERCDGNLD